MRLQVTSHEVTGYPPRLQVVTGYRLHGYLVLIFEDLPYLRKNFGQRIDHVIAQESLLQSESELRITALIP